MCSSSWSFQSNTTPSKALFLLLLQFQDCVKYALFNVPKCINAKTKNEEVIIARLGMPYYTPCAEFYSTLALTISARADVLLRESLRLSWTILVYSPTSANLGCLKTFSHLFLLSSFLCSFFPWIRPWSIFNVHRSIMFATKRLGKVILLLLSYPHILIADTTSRSSSK